MHTSFRSSPVAATTTLAPERRRWSHDQGTVPVLEPRHRGVEEALSERLPTDRPVVAFVAALLSGFVVLAAVVFGFGLLLVHVLLPFHGFGGADEHVNTWLASHRTPGLDDASYIGSSIGDIPVLPAIVAVAVIAMVIRRRWAIAAFILGGILVEVAAYRAGSLLVHRERPTVVRLDHLPVNQSYPSGHVAASVVVYASLALLLTSRYRNRWVVWTCWLLAILLPAAVASSRMYRGMHHPTDAAAGALIGIASLLIALLAVRVALASRDARRSRVVS
jgi:undecaprenyl-diphosphatase